MKTIEQLKIEHAKELANLEKKLAIAEAMPAKPDNVMLTGCKLYPWVSYNVNSITEAISIFKSFDKILPMVYAKSACAIIANIDEYPEYADHIIDEYCIKIEVSQGRGYGPVVKICWYAEAGGYKVKVICELQKNTSRLGARFTFKGVGYESRVESKQPSLILNGLADRTVRFYSGERDEPQANYVYCFVSDDYECTEFSHAIAQLSLIDV